MSKPDEPIVTQTDEPDITPPDVTIRHIVRHAVNGTYLHGAVSENCVIAWREYVESGREDHFYVELYSPPAVRGQAVVSEFNPVDDLKPWEPVPGDFIPVIVVEIMEIKDGD